MKSRITKSWSGAIVAGLLTASMSALAAPVSLPYTFNAGFNGTSWDIDNNLGGSGCGGSSGTGFNDANASGRGDAYDDAWAVLIDGLVVGAPANTADLTGSTLTVGPVVRSGLNVTLQHYYSTTSSLARVMVFMQNPGGAPATVNVQVPINFGSDGSTIIRATSSGDTAITNADRWVVSSDAGPSDPVNTTVFYGTGSPSVVPASYTTTVHSCAGTQGLGAAFNVTIPAGATRSLMFFAGLGGVTAADNSVASATSAAALFNSGATLAPDWLSGLTVNQQSQIANWDFFTTCAAEGYTGPKLTLCRKICEVNQPASTLNGLIRLYTAIYRQAPPCAQ